ncbi:site-specific integrase [Acinetobacter baumannii]|uniref:site-specific integrase n=1 Tax=Acinetobacter baumannii TaxID=470 RepID=UPI003AF5F82B
MAKSEVIATQIRELVESIFQEMLKVIAGRKASSPGIDRQIESVWLDFQVELKDFFKQNHLTTAPLRAPYLQQSEAYFFQLKEDYLSASKQAYPIKFPSLIYDEINQRVDTTFQQMLQVISQHQGNLVEIDSQIDQIWASFQEELQQFLKDKKIATVALRAPYLQWAEDCLVKRKEAYENASEQAYLIKIPATVYHQITLQVRYIFQNIETVIEGQTESKPEIDDQIVRIWGNFSKGLDAFLKNKNFTTRTQRKPYIKHSEACFVACLEQYQKQEKEPYPIKLRPTTLFSDPPPRQLLSSEARLRLGQQHFHIARGLKAYWRSDALQLKTAQQCWGNLYLSLIYCSGCSDLTQLVAIGNRLLENGCEPQLAYSTLYRNDYKKTINPLILTYRMQHRYYGNEIEGKTMYQWRHVWFNPYAQMCLYVIEQQGVVLQPQCPRAVLEAILSIFEDLKKQLKLSEQITALKKLLRCQDQELLKITALKPFQHVNLALEINSDLSLDMCLSEVLRNHLKTVSLTATDQGISWFNPLISADDRSKQQHELLPLETETAKAVAITAHQQLKEIPFELEFFEKERGRIEQDQQNQRQRHQQQFQQWRNIRTRLQEKNVLAGDNYKEKNLIEAQLRILAWIFHLQRRNVKLSSIKRYLNSFAKDYFFHLYLYDDDLQQMNAEDYEQLYVSILNGIDERAEAQRESTESRNQGRAKFALDRLKDFHAFCQEKYKGVVPIVDSFKYPDFQRIQFCQAKLISPRLFNQFKQRLIKKIETLSTEKEKVHLRLLLLMYVLAYRLGCRLNEIRCLTLGEIICPQLLWRDDPLHAEVAIRISLKNNVYRRLKSQNAQRQLDLNAVLLDDELRAVKCYLLHCLQQPNLKEANRQLVFEIGGEILSETYITQMTRLLFDEIIGPAHGFTFHSFRHSAANHLAIVWLGSKKMVMTYTDYTWQQANSMRKHLFGEAAMKHEVVVQHKWRLLADWMGHSSIEQTASHYLHSLDLLAIDRIYDTPCEVHPSIFNRYFNRKATEVVDLNRDRKYLQEFKPDGKVLGIDQKVQSYPIPKMQFELKPLSYKVVYQYLNTYQNVENQASDTADHLHIWVKHALWLAAKWQVRRFQQSDWKLDCELSNPDNNLRKLYDLQVNSQVKPKILQQFTAFKDHFKEQKVLSALMVLIEHGKLRRNKFSFQCRLDAEKKPKMDWDMQTFIEGMRLLLPEDVQLKYENYPVDHTKKSREIQVCFMDQQSQQNITSFLAFDLLLVAVQHPSLCE